MAKKNINCIDVSTWQGVIDWKKVKAAGYGHAIIRAGFGREISQVDNQFERNYKNAKAAGVKLGAYWYSYAVDRADAVKEAKACLAVLKDKTFEMPIFFDMEESSMTKLGKTTLAAMAKAFCDTVIKGGFRCGVYSNPNWFTNYLNYNTLKKAYPIWLAQYYKEAQMDCDIWQHSSTGSVPGISGSVDMNIIYNNDIINTSNDKKTELTKPSPTTSEEDFKVKVTSVNGLNCRKGAGTNYPVVKAFTAGTILKIVELISFSQVKVSASAGLNCRKGAGTEHNKIEAFPTDTILKIYEKKSNWGRTDSGWVCLDYTKEISSKETWGKCSNGWVCLKYTKKI